MKDWKAAQLLASEIGYAAHADTSILARALSYLGISSSYLGRHESDQTKLFIPIEDAAAESHLQAEFDPNSRQWRLVHARTDSQEDPGTVPSIPGGSLSTHNDGDRHQTIQDLATYVENTLVEDWTESLPRTKHVDFLKSRNWAVTTLGPMRDWPSSLRLMTLKMLADPRAANLYWGPTHIAIYNEPFVTLAASRHPAMMGSTAEEAMPATWPFLSRMFAEVEESGIAFSIPEFEMSVEKTPGFIEEAWYDGIFSPIRREDGRFLGLYNSGFEITDLKMSDRRTQLLHRISTGVNFHRVTPWQHIVNSCQHFERDIPLLVVYSAATENTAQSHRCSLQFEGSLGIERGHPAIPEKLELHEGNDDFVPSLRAAKAKGSSLQLEMPDGRLPDFLVKDVQWRGFGEPATHIVVVPIIVTGLICGFLIVGLNPRRPYDEKHRQFVDDLDRVSTGLISSGISFDQAKAREEKLSKELTAREKFIKKVVEVATVGIYYQNTDGLVTWANSKFYTLTGISDNSEDDYQLSGMDYVLEEDKARATHDFKECVWKKTAKTSELRLKRNWSPPGSDVEESCWLMVSQTPKIENGEVVGVLGSVTDINHLKWAEKLQIKTAEVAKEAKRQQESFMDITSHEMRNPLNAILQCADGILLASQRNKTVRESDQELAETFDSMLENARTVLFCAAHQKRILDDILTVSKMDSSMLAITPVCVDPLVVAGKALQMFETELSANSIGSSSTLMQSYHDLEIKWVYCDPSRLTQILINLLANAVKFTKAAEKREISVRVGASTEAPVDHVSDLQWSHSGQSQKVAKPLPDMGTGEEVYLMFEVQDTGKGISQEEMSLLFNRFSQANPRTHVQYGGSGLGLFISRELTELQGGLIGSSSVPGRGSTFAFYIRTRKAPPPDAVISAPKRTTSASGRESLATIREGRRVLETLRPMPSSTSEHLEAVRSVLLVEDNLINQKVLSKQLLRLGCKVYIANHGTEALELIKKSRFWRDEKGAGIDFDVILMDWEMPIMDGLTCTKHIRDFEQEGLIIEHLTIIATTANARPEQVQMAFTAGVDDLLAKPFTVSTLLERIESLIESKC